MIGGAVTVLLVEDNLGDARLLREMLRDPAPAGYDVRPVESLKAANEYLAANSADIVLLEKNLAVLIDGVEEGRRTFANTLKYVFMAVSANFGNMFSMAGASLFLPFLPLLPK